MTTRLYRVSCFTEGVPISGQCAKHFAPRTRERSDVVFLRERRKIPSLYGRVIQHQGNLARDAYRIIRDATTWTHGDTLAARHTAFENLEDLLNALGGFYPSLDVSKPEVLELADLYDAAQAASGDPRRAHRWQRGV